jgi:photosystem II stability/assembly factor-like uncharacterized protein
MRRQDLSFWYVVICLAIGLSYLFLLSQTQFGQANALSSTEIPGQIELNLPLIFKYASPTPTKTPIPTPSPTPIIPTPVGPIGGTFTSLAVDPNQNDNLYAGHFESGVYKSYDQGVSWYRKSTGLGTLKIQSLAAHPTNSNIVYAGTYEGGIYKSVNAGDSWTAFNGGVLGNHIIYDIEIDPNNPQVVYVVTRIQDSLIGYLYKSTTAGASWSLLLNGKIFSTPDYFYDVDVNPLNSNELYLAAHEHGFYKSTNAGASFTAINNGVEDLSARSFALDPAYAGLLYAGVWHDDSIYRTWNNGISWMKSSYGLPEGSRVYRIYVDPFGRTQKRVFACTYGNGLYSSDDFAQSWISRGLTGQRLYDFLVTDGNPQRWYAATESNGIFRSTSYGAGWNTIMGGLSLNAITGMVRDEESDQQYVAVYGKGVYEVLENGQEWQEISEGIEDQTVIDLGILEGRLTFLTENNVFVKDGDAWSMLELPSIRSESTDNTYQSLSEKVGLSSELLSNHYERNVSAVNQSTALEEKAVGFSLFATEEELYLGTVGNGLYKRVNNDWESLGFEGMTVIDLEAGVYSEELFASVCDVDNTCKVFLLKNGAWQPAQTGFGDQKVYSLLRVGEKVLAAADFGLYQWSHEELLWQLIQPTPAELLSITGSACVYAAGGNGFMIMSQDCGLNWKEVDLEDWHYQSISLLSPGLILLGSRETGAILLSFD